MRALLAAVIFLTAFSFSAQAQNMRRPPDFVGREVFETIRGMMRSDNSQMGWRQPRSLHSLCFRCGTYTKNN